MLTRLHIENIAVIEKADITFGKGFTVLTGETGSGKSILIDSVNLLLGDRTAKELIRTGETKAVVSASFEDIGEDNEKFLDTYGISAEDGLIIIQRNIISEGRSSVRINGLPVTLSVLREAGKRLINFHGQHENNNLLDISYHIRYIDAYANDAVQLDAYKKAFARINELKKTLSSAEMDENEKKYKQDMLSYQVNEITSAALSADNGDGEDEEAYLTRIRSILLNREKLSTGIEEALSAYDGDENEGISALISRMRSGIASASRYDEALEELNSRIEDLNESAAGIAEAIRDYKYENLSEGSELSIDEVEGRLELIKKLKRKYGDSIAEILAFADNAKKELDDIEFSDERAAKLRRELTEAAKGLKKRAEELTEARKTAASEIEKGVNTQLAFLEMKSAVFACEITPVPPGENGADRVEFLISANKGEPLKSLARIASGGELSRIMLSIKNVLASADSVGTLIFDEIDTGVSGRAAGKIADKLKEMAASRQIIAVTHLSQLAAKADNHFLIEKSSDENRTYTRISLLDTEGRVEELARIIGGENITETVRKTARELLDSNNTGSYIKGEHK